MYRQKYTRKNTQKTLPWVLKFFAYGAIFFGAIFITISLLIPANIHIGLIDKNIIISDTQQWLFLVLSLFAFITGLGLLKQKKWAWKLGIIDFIITLIFGIIASTLFAVTWPDKLGAGWLTAFFLYVIVNFVLIISALIMYYQLGAFFASSAKIINKDINKRLGIILSFSILSLLLFITIVNISFSTSEITEQASPNQKQLLLSIDYCESLDTAANKDDCFTQIAIAAANNGDPLPDDFCSYVSLGQPQLKFLCIAYSRQVESCSAFTKTREIALCRALVTGNEYECDIIENPDDNDVCHKTVIGYLDALQVELQKTNPPNT